ncbi:MAG: hypothetical protein FWG74_09550 [Planctomycetes bacterium]|nr:hypothetical protein [Planctomycetota bacterium]
MSKEFNPMRVVRLLSPDVFAELAASAKGDPVAARENPPDYWRECEPVIRRQLGALLREIDDMASGDVIAVALAEAGDNAQTVADALGEGGNHDRAAALLRQFPDLARIAQHFARSDREVDTRYWVARTGMPGNAANVSEAALADLGRAVAGFFQARQGRGEYHHVEHLRRAGGQDYVFMTLADYTDNREEFDDRGRLARFPVNPAFDVIFAHDAAMRSLSVRARGGRKIIEPLQEIFAAAILGGPPDPEDARRRPYRLNGLLRREFDFSTDPEDGVRAVRLREVLISVIGNEAEKIRLTAPREPVTVHDMFDQYINHTRLPLSLAQVERARMSFQFAPGAVCRSLTFDITPGACTLKGKSDEQRVLAEKYLRRWNIEVA